ncbi:hypothetical protein KR49_00110 [Synechococcus sp. KORDI-49]|nr:hypothetical protein KR49_00110 [Synechococcus sp. KORDI-49]
MNTRGIKAQQRLGLRIVGYNIKDMIIIADNRFNITSLETNSQRD